jgi:hypothetical protein
VSDYGFTPEQATEFSIDATSDDCERLMRDDGTLWLVNGVFNAGHTLVVVHSNSGYDNVELIRSDSYYRYMIVEYKSFDDDEVLT